MIRGTFHSLHPLLAVGEWIYAYVCEETFLFVSFVLVRHPCAWPRHGTGLRKRCQLCWLHSYLSSTPDPLTHLRRLCLSNHLFCKMKWQQIKRLSQMVLMCFPHIGPLHAFSSRAPHFHVFHSLLCGFSHPPSFNFVYWQTILTKKIKQNQYCFYNESLQSQSCDYPFFAENIRPHLLCVMVWIAEDFVDKFTRNLERQLFFLLSTS